MIKPRLKRVYMDRFWHWKCKAPATQSGYGLTKIEAYREWKFWNRL